MRGLMGGKRSIGRRFAAVLVSGGLLGAAVLDAPAQAVASTGPAVTCTYTIQSVWHGGFVADIKINNNGLTAINGWTLQWTFSDYTTDITAWQSTLSAPDGVHATAANVSYNATIPSGYSVLLGWSARALSTAVPSDLSINGVAC